MPTHFERTDRLTDTNVDFEGFRLKTQDYGNGHCWNLEHITLTCKGFTSETCSQFHPVEAQKQMFSLRIKVVHRETVPCERRGTSCFPWLPPPPKVEKVMFSPLSVCEKDISKCCFQICTKLGVWQGGIDEILVKIWRGILIREFSKRFFTIERSAQNDMLHNISKRYGWFQTKLSGQVGCVTRIWIRRIWMWRDKFTQF